MLGPAFEWHDLRVTLPRPYGRDRGLVNPLLATPPAHPILILPWPCPGLALALPWPALQSGDSRFCSFTPPKRIIRARAN